MLGKGQKFRILPGQDSVLRFERNRPLQVLARSRAIARQTATERQSEKDVLAIGFHGQGAIQMPPRYVHIAGIQTLDTIIEMIVRCPQIDFRSVHLSCTNLRIGTGLVGDMGGRTGRRFREACMRGRKLLLRKQTDGFFPLLHLRLQRGAGLYRRRFERCCRLHLSRRFHRGYGFHWQGPHGCGSFYRLPCRCDYRFFSGCHIQGRAVGTSLTYRGVIADLIVGCKSACFANPVYCEYVRMKPLLAVSLLSTVILAQTFRSTTALVRAETLVEENGHVVTGLQPEDFIILDEEQPQPVSNFTPEAGSIHLVLLLDSSGSMQPAARQLAQTGLAAMSVLHSDDMVGLMTFDKKATVRVPLTVDRNAVMAGVSKVLGKPMGGGTDIYHSLSDAAKYLGTGATVPNVILVLTDNAARADTTEAAALKDLWAASTSVDALVISSAPLWDEKISQSLAGTKLQDVRRIADQTGGVVRQTPDVATALQAMLERSRTRYTLFFRQADAPPGTLRHLKISLSPAALAKHPTAVVRSRTAYYTE